MKNKKFKRFYGSNKIASAKKGRKIQDKMDESCESQELHDDVQQCEVQKLKALDEKLQPIYVPTKVVPTDEQLEVETLICKSRNELVHWWNLCFYGAAQQHSFAPFYSIDFTEELLEEHEHELEKIKKHYNDNAPLFAKVQEVQNLWAKRLELECLSKDPTRLGNYKILTQEEKDRNRVTNRLPKV